MKKLILFGQVFEAERIVKTEDAITGYNGDTPEWSFRGINDWSQFQLEEGQDLDVDEKAAEAAYLLDLDFRISMFELGVL